MITKDILHKHFEYRDGNLLWKEVTSNRVKGGDVAGYPREDGYIGVGLFGKVYLLHKLVYAWHTGSWPDLIDHKDTDKNNNRIENLRPASKQENEINSNKSFGSSGLRGVSKMKTGRFRSYIVQDYRQIHIGVYNTAEEAYKAYIDKREELYPGLVKC